MRGRRWQEMLVRRFAELARPVADTTRSVDGGTRAILGFTSAQPTPPLAPPGSVELDGRGPAMGRVEVATGDGAAVPPRVVAAAVRYRGEVYSLPPPARHHDVIALICARHGLDGYQPSQDDRGFLLSDGRYARRRAAAVVAVRAGQCERVAHPRHGLFSEDLW